MEKHLYRSASNRWIAGVCGGIAEFTGVPALLIRLLWIGLSVIALPVSLLIGILLYIAAIFLLPSSPVRAVQDPNVIDAEFEIKE
ncbi:PspC domain-containing protein [Methanorbis furvi]|uniref:Phage shock protein PspC N-terminal domain-containing protein n=1 Tax=Methanorbis furvi TaxID=3028299 RepID=A0AAE4S9T8_9EURY|nr:hypothetical protein [Methanocorpusculaceae archaeon Ag1]